MGGTYLERRGRRLAHRMSMTAEIYLVAGSVVEYVLSPVQKVACRALLKLALTPYPSPERRGEMYSA
jgi:hypothetical protein